MRAKLLTPSTFSTFNFFMKSSSPKRRIRPIHARAATADPSVFEDYGPEPNMKLSHAFIVVLALHVVAVGGLFAFNKVKAHHALATVKIKTEAVETAAVAALEAASSRQVAANATPLHAAATDMVAQTAPVAPPSSVPPTPAGAPGNLPTLPVASSPAVVAAPTPQATAPLSQPIAAIETAPTVASTEYTVVKGDNPYKIAKRFHVSYDGLMKINNITDPRKIQIGQKLKIPAAAPHKTAKHG